VKIPNAVKHRWHVIPGVKITWKDKHPLDMGGTLYDVRIKHKNFLNLKLASDLWREHCTEMRAMAGLLWRVDLKAVFRYKTRLQEEERRVVSNRALASIESDYQGVIEGALRYGANLEYVEFTVECLGRRSPKDSDYGDFVEKVMER